MRAFALTDFECSPMIVDLDLPEPAEAERAPTRRVRMVLDEVVKASVLGRRCLC